MLKDDGWFVCLLMKTLAVDAQSCTSDTLERVTLLKGVASFPQARFRLGSLQKLWTLPVFDSFPPLNHKRSCCSVTERNNSTQVAVLKAPGVTQRQRSYVVCYSANRHRCYLLLILCILSAFWYVQGGWTAEVNVPFWHGNVIALSRMPD